MTLILAALAAGAKAGLGEAASEAVKDAYHGLKALVLSKLGGNDAGRTAVEQAETDPDTWDKPASKALTEADATNDDQILAAAKRLLELADPEGASGGRYTIIASGTGAVAAQTIHGGVTTNTTRLDLLGAQGVQLGNQNTQTNTFN